MKYFVFNIYFTIQRALSINNYIKIDVEGFELDVLKGLISRAQFPPE